MSTRIKEQWGSRIGVILAVAGSAVGLGNFLRFPGQAAQNGGGAFLIPYFIALLLLGIPLCWAEWTMGRWGGQRGFHSCPAVYNLIWRNPLAKYFGTIGLLIPLVVYMYYVVIEAWCLGYAWSFLTGELPLRVDGQIVTEPEAYGDFWGSFVGMKTDGALFTAGGRTLLVMVLITFVANFVLIYRGITKGIETFCKFAMPLMVLCALCVLFRVLTLGTPDPTKPDQNVLTGLGFMWNPNMNKLLDFETWLAASGQIFFSISVGFGIIINYASYLRRKDDVVLSGLTAASTNEFFEVVLGGLITIPAGLIFLGAAIEGQGTFGLGFNTLPVVFSMMPGGRLFGFLWFFMLFLAAITSSLSMLQPVIAFLEEGFNLPRRASAAILGMLALSGSAFVAWFSKDAKALDTFDFWVGTALIFMLALIQTLLYSWVFGWRQSAAQRARHSGGRDARASAGTASEPVGLQYASKSDLPFDENLAAADQWRMEQAHQGAHLRIPAFVGFILKYVSPAFLIVIFVGTVINDGSDRIKSVINDPVAFYSVMLIGGIFVFLALLVFLAAPRWEKMIRERGGPDVEVES